MSTIFGLANLTASDYQFARQANQELLYNAVGMYLEQANMAMNEAASLFIETTTENHTERYQLPMTGRMQRTPEDQRAAAVKRSGYWDVAYPLHNFSDNLTITDVDFAYMTPAEFQAHIDGIIIRAANTQRHEILKRLFKNTTDTFSDPRNGSLTIQPIANGDAVLYPPVLGSESEAAEDHYLETGYAAAAISDSNNPIATAVADLVHHFGRVTGGIEAVTLINTAQRAVIEDLTNFVPVVQNGIIPGSNTDDVRRVPGPGALIGHVSESYVRVWDWIPANYMLTIHTGEAAPLKKRVDISGTNLGGGMLTLAGTLRDFPITYSDWRLRFGIGAGNRLNGVVTELGTGGTYSIPAAYS